MPKPSLHLMVNGGKKKKDTPTQLWPQGFNINTAGRSRPRRILHVLSEPAYATLCSRQRLIVTPFDHPLGKSGHLIGARHRHPQCSCQPKENVSQPCLFRRYGMPILGPGEHDPPPTLLFDEGGGGLANTWKHSPHCCRLISGRSGRPKHWLN